MELKFSKSLLWHGTGRYQHIDDKNTKTDILKEIILKQGIIPHKNTISLSKIRTYASIFAYIYQDEKKPLKNLYHSRLYWLIFILLSNFIHNPFKLIYLTFKYSKENGRDRMVKFQIRARKKQRLKIFPIFIMQYLNMARIKSDIATNYPILIAVDKNKLKSNIIRKGPDIYEVKITEKINFNNISHIEVPCEFLKETQKLLLKNNIKIPILAIETVEKYLKKKLSIFEMV